MTSDGPGSADGRRHLGSVKLRAKNVNENVSKMYLYIDQLSEVTPWSVQAIRTMVARGIFRKNIHYFQPHGPGSRTIFSWPAIVRFIEEGPGGAVGEFDPTHQVRLANGNVIDLK